ncbi:RNA polymerase sigma factor [Heliomicrobium gestii]|uniref:RNA polymerase sigma factor n=1 Tax=Heliomicrobium gestii TaxID=2699 RepID=UPI001958758A|nr:sigma factor [Heliomicrobium gestii]MBM7866321.1 hypothetical protein [Heliomicrobium gestii]
MDGRHRRIGEVFRKEHKNFVQYVRRKVMGISDMDAEDIVAEVFFNMFNRADLEGHVENLTAYMYRSVKHKVVDFLRKRRQPVSLDQIDPSTGLALGDQVQDPGADVEAARHKKEMQQQVQAACFRRNGDGSRHQPAVRLLCDAVMESVDAGHLWLETDHLRAGRRIGDPMPSAFRNAGTPSHGSRQKRHPCESG